jgi:hypothetical protein
MFYFVIDCDQYAGNYEREMTAYITGCIGDCGVGGELSKELSKDGIALGFFDDLIINEPDENGCARPCKMWDTPGWFNEGLGGNFQDGQEEEAKAFHRKACLERANDLRSVHPKNAESHKQRWLEKADEFEKYPSYNSVAICMERAPTEEELNVLKSRALKYPKYVESKIKNAKEGEHCFLKSPTNISGFRLIEEKTTYTEVQSWSA